MAGSCSVRSCQASLISIVSPRTKAATARMPRRYPIGDFYSVRKYVATRTLGRVDWNNSTLITGDVEERIKTLKGEPGNELQVHGSGELIQTLLRHNLIDEFRLWIFPVLLGTGKRLFSNGTVPARLKRVETQTSSTGVVLQVHQSAGNLEYGSFALEQPSAAETERQRRVVEAGE